MPELDGTTVVALISFAALLVAWLVAPTREPVAAAAELGAAA